MEMETDHDGFEHDKNGAVGAWLWGRWRSAPPLRASVRLLLWPMTAMMAGTGAGNTATGIGTAVTGAGRNGANRSGASMNAANIRAGSASAMYAPPPVVYDLPPAYAYYPPSSLNVYIPLR